MGIDICSGRLLAENNVLVNAGLWGVRLEDSPGAFPDSSLILGNKIYQTIASILGSIGIYAKKSDYLGIRDKKISGYDQAGIKIEKCSPEAKSNEIYNINHNGMLFYSNGNSQIVRSNHLYDANCGVWCEANSYPDLGRDIPLGWGMNSIHDMIIDPVVNFSISGIPVYAQRNWWGEPRCPAFTTFVICFPPLETDPLAKAEVEQPELPKEFALHQNYPNPFNSSTIIKFDLPEASAVKLKIYNILGQQVRFLVNDHLPAGYQSVVRDGRNNDGKKISSGIYLYVIEADDFRSSKKMTILK